MTATHRTMTRRTAASLLAAGIVLAGCGSSKSTGSTTPAASGAASSGAAATSGGTSAGSSGGATAPGADAAAVALLPASVKSAGVLRSVTDGTYAPNEFSVNGGPLQGFDIDLENALGTKLGVKVQIADAKFATILTGIVGNRYDISFSSFSDNPKRQKQVDFVDYFTAGTAILVKKGNPEHINTLTDLCGKNVALESGTIQVGIAQGAQCPGGKKVNVTELPDDATARLQVVTGRAVADLNDYPVAAYNAKTFQNGNAFEVVGQQYSSGPYGIAINKSEKGLTQAVQAGMKALIADGTYDKILAKWDLTKGALKTAAINGGK